MVLHVTAMISVRCCYQETQGVCVVTVVTEAWCRGGGFQICFSGYQYQSVHQQGVTSLGSLWACFHGISGVCLPLSDTDVFNSIFQLVKSVLCLCLWALE